MFFRGAGQEPSEERPLLSHEQVAALADAIELRYRVAVLLAGFGSLRRGEVLGLQVKHFDEVAGRITVEHQAQRIKGQGRVLRPTKSEKGKRTVNLPVFVVAEVAAHIAEFCDDGAEGWLLTDDDGEPTREHLLAQAWRNAAVKAGVELARFHDLRHYAGTVAAQTGYTTREVQARLAGC